MALVAALTPPHRHPWLDEFERAPVSAFGDLLAGYARIPPYEQADAPDAARMLFGPLPADDPARLLLDSAISDWLEQRRRQSPPVRDAYRQNWLREVCEAFEIVSLLEVGDAAVTLRRREDVWNEWTARFFAPSSRDVRAAYWQLLALTQPLVADSAPNDLAPLWLNICRAADGTLPHRYLRIGLLGLRRLPGALDGAETPWVAGLAHWALEHDPSPAAFQNEWLALKPMYPRTGARWRVAVGQILATRALQTHREELLAKWRGDSDITPMLRPDFSMRGHEIAFSCRCCERIFARVVSYTVPLVRKPARQSYGGWLSRGPSSNR